MNYISTRNNQKNFTFKDVFLKGLADDGGLFVPDSIEQFKKEKLNNLRSLSYNDLAAEIIHPFIGDFMSKDDLNSLISAPATNAFFSEPVIITDLIELFWFNDLIQLDNSSIVSLLREFKKLGLFIVIKAV